MSMLQGRRNDAGLTDWQIAYCLTAWSVLCGDEPKTLITDEASNYGSHTRFPEARIVTYLGADAYPGNGPGANSRMSVLACLAHELSHVARFEQDYRRPLEMPDMLIDEAETSINASFSIALSRRDREDLIEDARDRLSGWLMAQSAVGEE